MGVVWGGGRAMWGWCWYFSIGVGIKEKYPMSHPEWVNSTSKASMKWDQKRTTYKTVVVEVALYMCLNLQCIRSFASICFLSLGM